MPFSRRLTGSFLAVLIRIRRETINFQRKPRGSSRAAKGATFGMWTAMSSSNTEWVCERSLSDTPLNRWSLRRTGKCFLARISAVRPGSKLTTPDDLLQVLTNADMVKFAKNGSDVTTAAVKLARAYTGREMIAICADHPFFSVDDWFIGTTETNAGIPRAVQDLTVSFRYNDLDSLKEVFDELSEPDCVHHNGTGDVGRTSADYPA